MTYAVDSSIASRSTESEQVGNMVSVPTKGMETNVRVQLRPVGHPSPVTQLFEYTLNAWEGQKGDHCTYKYTSSRESHMEMSATVLVRLPNKPSLLVKDSKFRQSRVLAQNAVAHLALQKLAQDDPELKETLDQMAKEVEERKAAALAEANAPPPPPPPSRFTTEPHHFHWSSGGAPRARRHQYPPSHYPAYHHQIAPPQPSPYFAPGPGGHFYPPAPFMPHPLQPSRSTSAPELVPAEGIEQYHPSYDAAVMKPSGYYHPMEFGGYVQPPASECTPSTDTGATASADDPSPHPMASVPQWPPMWNSPYYPQPPSPHQFYGPPATDYHYYPYVQQQQTDEMMMYAMPPLTSPTNQLVAHEIATTTTDDEDSRGVNNNQKTNTALCH